MLLRALAQTKQIKVRREPVKRRPARYLRERISTRIQLKKLPVDVVLQQL